MGDERAYRHMYKNYVNDIYLYLYWRTNELELAQDLTSEVFTKAWNNWDNFDGKYPKAWLYKIAKNQLIDYWRSKKDVLIDRREAETLLDDRESVVDKIDSDIAKKKLYRALSTLPETMRDVIELKVLNSLSSKETGGILGLSESNVRVIQYRALKKLRVWYEKNQ
jgi:RNA polymerase sigma-70 factor (ECF subfamily)